MATIEERAEKCANEWRCDESFGTIEYHIEKALVEQDRIARQEEREKAELNFCVFCNTYDNCGARYSCETFEKFHNAMEE